MSGYLRNAIYDEDLEDNNNSCRFSSFLSHDTALTWSAAEPSHRFVTGFLTDLSFSSATECERHPDLAGSNHRLKPRPSPRVSGGGLRPYGFRRRTPNRGGLSLRQSDEPLRAELPVRRCDQGEPSSVVDTRIRLSCRLAAW